MKDVNKISNHSEDCIPTDVLIKYIKGELSGYRRNLIERHIASCEICSDELEGLSLLEKPESIDEITIDLHRRVDAIILKPKKEIPYLRLSVQIAATILILIGVSSLYFFIIYKQPKPDYAKLAEMELKEIAGSEKIDTLLLGMANEIEMRMGHRKDESVDAIASMKYVAPVVVDSVVENEVTLDVRDDAIAEIVKEDEVKVAEAKQVITESVVQLAAPASTDKKSALGGVARSEKNAMLDKLDEKFAELPSSKQKQIAIRLYEKKDYELALNVFEKIPVNDSISLYKSICYYRLGRFDEAISNLTKLVKNPQKAQFAEARWYYALALIGAQKRDEAIAILEQIVKDDSTYTREAKKELNKLKGNQ